MDIFRSPDGYWIGPSINTLPCVVATILKSEFDIIEHQYDVSILTLPKVKYVLYYISEESVPFISISIKICINLNKKIILLHNSNLYEFNMDLSDNDSVILDLIDVSKEKSINKIKSCSLQLSMQQTNLNPLNDLTINQQLHSNLGSRIDIFRILQYIEDNLEKEIREHDIAELCHYSVTYFSKLFHNVVGISFRDYLTNKRINKAKHILSTNQNEKMAYIAYQCGYNDVSYFSRIFKKKTGLTPGNYKKLHRSNRAPL